jgi:formate--tetrahydrofolate ligase
LGGDGALEFADTVVDACNEENDFKFLYPLEMKLRDRVDVIAREVYGADGVDWSAEANTKAEMLENDPKYADFATMMVKSHLSLSHDPTKKGVPKGWRLPIRDILIYSGAKFLCPCAGAISLMPGTSSNPAFRRIDVDTDTGKVTGLF